MSDDQLRAVLGQVRAQLVAMQSVLEVTLAMVDHLADPGPAAPTVPRGCQHLDQIDASTFGADSPGPFFCSDCGAEVPLVPAEAPQEASTVGP